MRRKEKIIVAAVLVVVLVYAVWRGVSGMAGGRDAVTLTDGTRFAPYTATWGKSHSVEYFTGPQWFRPFARMLPTSLANRLGWNTFRHVGFVGATSSDAVFWFLRTGPGASRGMRLRDAITDDSGSEVTTGDGCFSGDEGSNPRPVGVFPVAPSMFPRRSRYLTVRVYGCPLGTGGPSRLDPKIAEFTVRNRLFGKFPEWVPGPMPQSVCAGDTTFTLKTFVSGVADPGTTPPAKGSPMAGLRYTAQGEQPWTRAVFTIDGPDATNREWIVVGVKLSDATGNLVEPRSPRCNQDNRELCLDFPGSLWRSERAWKLTVEFARSRGFEPREQWAVEMIPVPEKKECIPLDLFAEVLGMRVQLHGVAGTGYCAQDWHWFPEDPGISLKVSLTGTSATIGIAAATDDAGNQLRPGRSHRMPDGLRILGIHPAEGDFDALDATGARFVDVTFSVQKNRVAEYLVDPNDATVVSAVNNAK